MKKKLIIVSFVFAVCIFNLIIFSLRMADNIEALKIYNHYLENGTMSQDMFDSLSSSLLQGLTLQIISVILNFFVIIICAINIILSLKPALATKLTLISERRASTNKKRRENKRLNQIAKLQSKLDELKKRNS